MLLFPFLLLAHLGADFILQTDTLMKEKALSQNGKLHTSSAFRKHIYHHAVLAALVALFYVLPQHQWLWVFLIPLVTAVSHFFIDMIKLTIQSKTCHMSRLGSLSVFAIDQVLHVLVMLAIFYLYSNLDFHLLVNATKSLLLGKPIHLTVIGRVLSVVIIGVCGTWVSGVIVKLTTGQAPATAGYEIAHQVPRGRLIGYLERLLVIVVIAVGAYTAIAFIVTAKSIIRFKKLDHPEWAEYFLVGTLSSILCGSISGLVLKALLRT